MYKYIISLIFICLVCSVKAQTNYQFQITYEMSLNFNNYDRYECNLFFDKEKSFFSYSIINSQDLGIAKDQDDDQSYTFKVSDTSRYFIKTNKASQSIVQLEKGFGEDDFYIVEEDLQKISWNITSETKNIDSYRCIKATTTYKGREYIVWFTTDFPGYFGPWKLHGLPGIILEAHDLTQEVQIYATKIGKSNTPVNDDVSEVYLKIDRQDYQTRLNNFIDGLGKRMATKFGRGYRVQVKTPIVKHIEIYED
ncbi:GLPGLI family protein [Aquimarina sp. LLG6339-5]|uniref:GLPGLI family protein n=1 Tax=Aquimarina sp. LLG6339-5 TaxID=3160830 RepID=UPI0038669703